MAATKICCRRTTVCGDTRAYFTSLPRPTSSAQVLSVVPVFFSYWAQPKDCLDLSMMLNDHIARCVALHPRRFVGLGTVPMQAPELAAWEVRRCVTELGLAGIQIGTHIGSWTLDARELDPVWAAAEEVGAAVFVHPWDMVGSDLMRKYFLPWLVGMPAETSMAICSMIFGGVFERFVRRRLRASVRRARNSVMC
jgi:aminocarboxymuconate-semialdehyde decarboxylase